MTDVARPPALEATELRPTPAPAAGSARASADRLGGAQPSPDLSGALASAISAAILRSAPVGVQIEGEGTSWMNEALARLWRYHGDGPPPEGALWRDLHVPAGRDGSLDLRGYGASIKTGRWRSASLRTVDGPTVPVRVMRARVRHPRGTLVDVTYVVEGEPPEPDAQLRKAFLAMIGHELRTPITSIVAGAELLDAAGLDVPTRSEVTSLVVEEANRVSMLIDQLTALTLLDSSGSGVAREPIQMTHLARHVGAREARRCPGIQLTLPQLGARRTIALGDEALVVQVLTILIDNAGKYGTASGRLEVELAVEPAEDGIAVHVLDRGPGLQGADPARLFQMFQRAPAHAGDGRGTGIGLYVASRIVAAMDGRIWAADRRGGGADIGFTLPASE